MKKVLLVSKRETLSKKQRWELGGHTEIEISHLSSATISHRKIKEFIQQADIVLVDGSARLQLKIYELAKPLGKDILVPKYEITWKDGEPDVNFVCWERLLKVEFITERFEGC